MAKTITRLQYLQLLGLEALGRKHAAVCLNCENAMEEIIGLDSSEGLGGASEVLFGDRDVKWFLDVNSVTIAPEGEVPDGR